MCSEIIFNATIPPTASAIQIHGDGGARISLDIAESDMANMIPLMALRGKQLVVCVESRDNVIEQAD